MLFSRRHARAEPIESLFRFKELFGLINPPPLLSTGRRPAWPRAIWMESSAFGRRAMDPGARHFAGHRAPVVWPSLFDESGQYLASARQTSDAANLESEASAASVTFAALTSAEAFCTQALPIAAMVCLLRWSIPVWVGSLF